MTLLEVTNWVNSNATSIELRNYQAEAWLRLWTKRADNRKRALIHLATGLGKTSVAAVDALHYLKVENTKGKILFVSHMTDISTQAKNTFIHVNPSFTTSIFRGHIKDVDVTFATFQALYRKLDTIDPAHFDYIIWDEAHHIEAETFSAVRKHFTPQFELGLTATPERADGRDILNYFGKPLFAKSLADGIGEGWLSAVDYHIVFDEAVKNAMGSKFEAKTLREIRELFSIRTRNEVISKEVLQRRHAIGMDQAKTIVFCQNIDAGEAMANLLGGEVYHSDIKSEDRIDILNRFKSGKLQVICTVDMFNEGIDIPDAKLVVFLRSTSSRTIFEQQLGRGLRRAPGKDKVTVLDFVANVERINFVRDLGHTISELRGGGQTYPGIGGNYGATGGRTFGEHEPKYFELSNFEFEDQSIELLKRYQTLKELEYLTTEEILEAYEKLGTVRKVAQKFQVTDTAIYKRLKKAGIDTSGHLYKNLDNEEIAKKYFELRSAPITGKYFGISSWTVLDRVRKAGYETLPRSQAKNVDSKIVEAFVRNNHNLRATSRELGTDRNVLRKSLLRAGLHFPGRSSNRVKKEAQLAEAYTEFSGDITKIVAKLAWKNKWVDVYKALDYCGYLTPDRRPITSAMAAAAYYKYGNSTKAGELLGTSGSYVSKLSKSAIYIRKYKQDTVSSV